ncbi:hypothetical protein AC1031_000567 [Aphanomyces cochlioides]|nr:hypothetical protein AC1031_000567 [Aphanomyces cochlioides]
MTIWNDQFNSIWIDELIYQANVLGQRSDTGFKKSGFIAALAKLNQSPGLKKPFSMPQLRSRNEVKIGEFSIVHKMATSSGMGWEDTTCRVICTDTTWEAFFAQNSNPKVKKWQNKTFPLYHKCCELYAKTLATGNMTISSAQPYQSQNFESNSFSDDDGYGGSYNTDSRTKAPDNEPEDRQQPSTMHKRPLPASSEDDTLKPNISLASRIVAVFEKYDKTAEEEMKLLSKLVNAPTSAPSELSHSERALLLLQSEFTSRLSTDDLAIAFEVMENPVKATMFLRMEGELMRQIRALERA